MWNNTVFFYITNIRIVLLCCNSHTKKNKASIKTILIKKSAYFTFFWLSLSKAGCNVESVLFSGCKAATCASTRAAKIAASFSLWNFSVCLLKVSRNSSIPRRKSIANRLICCATSSSRLNCVETSPFDTGSINW